MATLFRDIGNFPCSQRLRKISTVALKGSEPSAPCTGLANVLNGHTVETDETSSPHNSPLDRAPGKYAWRYM